MGANVTSESHLPSGLVTFLFTDIEGSTRLAHTLGRGYRKVLHDHRMLLRQVFDQHTGAELLTEGDSFFVVFSDADQAVRAAYHAQTELATHNWPTDPQWSEPARPKVRMGIHTSQATPDEQGYATSAVHRAARVCGAAHGDQILCSQSTIESSTILSESNTSDLGLHQLRGFDDTERLHQVLGHDLPRDFPPPLAQRRHHNLPANEDVFIGRTEELSALMRLLDSHRLLTVTSLPGTGKSRLIRQLAHQVASSYKDGCWYAELRDDADCGEAISHAMGLRGDPFRPWIDTAIESLRSKNCLLVIDDATSKNATVIARILTQCPQVSILSAASRPLGLGGEVKWALPTMTIADAHVLLRHGVTAHTGGIECGDYTDLATLVDGFPPAINILAKAVAIFGRKKVHRQLRSDPMAVLDATGALSQIMDKAIAGLSKNAVKLLRAMAALPAPAGVDEAERLCGGSAEALAALIELVDATLVDVLRTDNGAKYRLPAPVRWHADAKRRDAGEAIPAMAPSATNLEHARINWAQKSVMS